MSSRSGVSHSTRIRPLRLLLRHRWHQSLTWMMLLVALWSHHNHDPALTGTPSGDLLAIWFTTWEECGREAALAIARLPGGSTDPNAEWSTAESFYDPPDRCMCCPALYADENQVLAFFSASPQASCEYRTPVHRANLCDHCTIAH